MKHDALTVFLEPQNDINSTCNGLAIHCPLNGECIVECNQDPGEIESDSEDSYYYIWSGRDIYSSCYNTVIRGEGGGSDISVLCSEMGSCKSMIIDAPNINSISINATNSC